MFKLAVKESNILYQAEAKINKAFQSYNCEDLMNIISKSSIHILSHFTDLHTRIAKSFPQSKLEIFTELSAKIVKNYATEKEVQKLNFYALTKFNHALSIIERQPDIEKESLSKALTLLNETHIIIQNNSLKLEITPDIVIHELIETYGTSSIEYSKQQAFTFAEDSLKYQKTHLPKDHPSILKLLLATAKMKYTFDLDTTCNEENALKLEESLKYAEAASDMASRIYDADSKVKALTLAVKICNLYGNDILANIFYQQTKTSLSPKSDHSSEEKYNSEAFEKKILDTNIPELPNVVSNNSLSKLSSINLDHPKNAANDLLNIIITLSLKTLTAEIKRDIKEADEFIITAEKGLKEIMEQSLQITSIKSDSELLTGAPSALTGDDIDILLSGVVG